MSECFDVTLVCASCSYGDQTAPFTVDAPFERQVNDESCLWCGRRGAMKPKGGLSMIPDKTRYAIKEWLERGTHPDLLGSFVRAVLSNDLRAAWCAADDENLAKLGDTISWIACNIPSGAHGSRDALIRYHESRRKGAA